MPAKPYHEDLIEQLKDLDDAAEYLTACFEESEEVFLTGLRNVVEAQGGIGNLAKLTELNRESLYKMLSEEGNPTLSSLATIFESIGLDLHFSARAA